MTRKDSLDIKKPSLSIGKEGFHVNAGGIKGEGFGGLIALVAVVALLYKIATAWIAR